MDIQSNMIHLQQELQSDLLLSIIQSIVRPDNYKLLIASRWLDCTLTNFVR